jgi:hypothetical protein
LPITEYVRGSCNIPQIATIAAAVLAGAIRILNTVVIPLPEKVSVKNDVYWG